VLRTFVRLRRLRLRIAVDGQPARAVRAPFVFVANNRYSGHLLSPNLRPTLDGGQLWVYTAHAHRHLTIVRMFFQSLLRRIDAADALEAQAGTEVVIEHPAGPLAAAVDGELVQLESPLRFRIRPRALRVLLPRAAEAAEASGSASIIAARVEPDLRAGCDRGSTSINLPRGQVPPTRDSAA